MIIFAKLDYSSTGDYGGGYMAQSSNFDSPMQSQERKVPNKFNLNVIFINNSTRYLFY